MLQMVLLVLERLRILLVPVHRADQCCLEALMVLQDLRGQQDQRGQVDLMVLIHR
jgi:hypothetical protein